MVSVLCSFVLSFNKITENENYNYLSQWIRAYKNSCRAYPKGASKELVQVKLLSMLEAQDNFELLHQADTLIFGTPTYMGTISADFKKFMEATGKFWYTQKWKDKFAAGFTNSSTLNGDKLNTLQQLSLFAAQHSMIWISTGIRPKFENDNQLEEPNGLASYSGLMTVSDHSTMAVNLPKGLETAELFGQRVAQITKQFKQSK